ANPGSEIPVASRDFVDGRLRFLPLPFEECRLQSGAQFLVGINGKNPVMSRAGGREVFLIGVVGPSPMEEPSSVLAGYGLGAVAAAGVDDHDIVSNGLERSQRARQIPFLVQRDDAGRDALDGVHGGVMSFSISQRRLMKALC